MEITVKQAAEQLQLTTRHVLNLIHEGKLIARPKTDSWRSHWLIEQSSVDEYIAKLKNLRQ